MIQYKFEPRNLCFVVLYGRMSDPRQSHRSPDQQFELIEETIAKGGYPWHISARFRDDGVTGQRVHSRPGLKATLAFAQNPANQIKFILVDHSERFGRSRELNSLRLRLLNHCGIVVLTADNGFMDPTTPEGEILELLDNHRATQSNRIKSRDVIRGKKDCVKQKHWPGGKPPLGYKLKSNLVELPGRLPWVFQTLEPDEETRPVAHRIFEWANGTGLGYTRLSRLLNADPLIPESYKPFNRTTVGRILRNTIYIGEYQHRRFNRGIISDRNLCRKNPDSEILTVPDFCEPLVEKKLFENVNADREARASRVTAKFQKQRAPDQGLARGISVKYLFTGLIYCAHCKSAMHAECGHYKLKSGEEREYCTFHCPRTLSGGCANRCYPKSNWLNQEVTELLLSHLGLTDGQRNLRAEIDKLLEEVRNLVKTMHEQSPKRDIESLQRQLATLRKKEDGLVAAIAEQGLPATLSERLKAQWTALEAQKKSIEEQLAGAKIDGDIEKFLQVDAGQIRQKLLQLPTLLASGNITRANVELALHIDKITVNKDGTVKVRLFKLGFLGHQHSRLETLRSYIPTTSDAMFALEGKAAQPRRRTLRDIEDLTLPESTLEKNLFSQDPNRFEGYPDDLFWVHSLKHVRKIPWCAEHAEEVYMAYQQLPNKSALARQFGKSAPTIARAIELHEELLRIARTA